ncbi:unnamed protein product, partial [Prorocentrum cordatum]
RRRRRRRRRRPRRRPPPPSPSRFAPAAVLPPARSLGLRTLARRTGGPGILSAHPSAAGRIYPGGLPMRAPPAAMALSRASVLAASAVLCTAAAEAAVSSRGGGFLQSTTAPVQGSPRSLAWTAARCYIPECGCPPYTGAQIPCSEVNAPMGSDWCQDS